MRIAKIASTGLLMASLTAAIGTMALAQDWNAPRGYDGYYHENGAPNMAARQGYAAGFDQGQSDFRLHHSFRPTHVDTYKHVPNSPQAINRKDFERMYHEAFERGYSEGFKG
jgi:hypothetical protein